jgi:hypothetical protein
MEDDRDDNVINDNVAGSYYSNETMKKFSLS